MFKINKYKKCEWYELIYRRFIPCHIFIMKNMKTD